MIDKAGGRRRRKLGQVLTDAVESAFGDAAGQAVAAERDGEDGEERSGGAGHDGRQTVTLP